MGMYKWDCLLILDGLQGAFGDALALRFLENTERVRVLGTSLLPLQFQGSASGFTRQLVIVRELSMLSCRELVRRMAPWIRDRSAYQIISKCRQSPGLIKERLEKLQDDYQLSQQ